MEHYPTVANPYEPIVVPFLGGDWVPGDDVSCSDLRLDRVRERLLQGDLDPEEEMEVMAKVQARLFFGMLFGVLQVDISVSNYVIDKKENNTSTLTTRSLKDDLQRWKMEHEPLRVCCHSESHGSTSKLVVDEAAQKLEKRREKAEKCLQDAFYAWMTLENDGLGVQDRAHHEDFLKVRLSLQLLGKALEHAIESVSQYCDDCTFESWMPGANVPWRRHSKNIYLTTRMENQEWCPVVIEALRRQGNLPLMYYTSLLGRPARQGHKAAGCTASDQSCRKLNIRNFPYEPRHSDECSQQDCQFMGPGEAGIEKATNIIENGGIPMLYLNQDGNMEVEQQRRGLEYTAISHVWADGLGHPRDEKLPGWRSNSLPACQIKRLVKLVSKLPWTATARATSEEYNDKVWKRSEEIGDRPLYTVEEMSKTIYFWIDTICIPHNHAKQRAIAQMAAVYGRANRVLVLDADLMATSLHAPNETAPVIEIRADFGAKVVACNWQKRYWTLQEGVLARRLWYQFKDDAYKKKTWNELVLHNFIQDMKKKVESEGKEFDVATLSRPVNPPTRPNFIEYCWDNEICYYAEPEDYSWGDMGLGTLEPEQVPAPGQSCTACAELEYGACAVCRALCFRTNYAWRELASRACSVASDKPLCIAILLDLDISVFETVTDEAERVQRLWEQFTVIPAGLLTLPSRKCKEPHLRWAPADLDHLGKFGNPVLHPAHITPKGVNVKLHGFTAKVIGQLKATSVIPVALGEMVYYVRNNTNLNNERWVEGPVGNHTINVDFQGVTELGVIIGHEPLGEGQPFPQFPAALGALVAVQRHDQGQVLVVKYIGAVSVIGKGTVFERSTTTPWTTEEEVEKLVEPLVGQPTPVNQKWLIVP